MKEIDPTLLKELPLLFQRVEIKKKSNPARQYSSTTFVRKLNSTKVDCENFDRPISKIVVLSDEV